MATLFVRNRQNIWINYVHDIQELRNFEENFIPGRHFVLGDLSQYSSPMCMLLLKLLEENSSDIDCYSSTDLTNLILLSRFSSIVKDPLCVSTGHDDAAWLESKHDYVNAEALQGTRSLDVKIRLPLLGKNLEKLISFI